MPLTCPARVDLTAFLLGKLSEDRCQDVASHLEECEDCQAQLATVGDTGDTLLAGIRRRELASEFEHESALRRAIGRIEQFGGEPSQAGPSVAAPKTFDSGPIDLGTLGSYRLLAKLGEGGMGAVYKALHVHLEKIVAIKVLPAERLKDPAAVGRFRREMKVVGKLDHPHLVHAFDAGEVDGQHFLAMEYVHGQDLSTLSRRRGPLPIAEACELIRQAALGLAAAHEHGLVHRDVKPANLMLAACSPAFRRNPLSAGEIPPEGGTTNGAFVKVLDLGLALLAGQPAAADLTSTGQFMGTVDYMAPEQAGDSHNVDIRADVYSLGATLYKLLTGEAPFAGPKYATLISKMMALASETAPPLREKRPDAPEELEAVLGKMLHREAGKRYSTPAEVAAALAPFCAGADLGAMLGGRESFSRDADCVEELKWPHSLPDRREKDSRPLSLSTAPASSQFVDSQVDRSPQSSPHAPREEAQPQTPDRSSAPRPLRSSHHAERDAYIRKYQRALAALAGAILLVLGVFLIVRTREGDVIVELGEGVKAEDVKIEISGDGGLSIADKQNGWTIGVKEGRYDVKLAGGDDKFTLDKEQVVVTRGKKTYLKVTLKETEPSAEGGSGSRPESDPDHRAAEWVISIGGSIQIELNDERRSISALNDLPEEAFDLVQVSLGENPKLDDRGLERLKDCLNLQYLDLHNTKIGDAGVARLQNCTKLVHVHLNGTSITDAALSYLRGCTYLTTLHLGQTEVTDAALHDLVNLENLNELILVDTRVSRSAFEKLKAALPTARIDWNGTLAESPWQPTPDQQAFLEALSSLEPKLQVEALAARLALENAGFDGKFEHEEREGRIVRVKLTGPAVKNLWPLAGLHGLETLDLAASGVEDLRPLAGMKLLEINVSGCPVTDLSPLKNMPLEVLRCAATEVRDLSPLAGMKLRLLNISYLPLDNLSVLHGIPLESLACHGVPFDDLSFVEGMPLSDLACTGTKVSDLTPLRGLPLKNLDVATTPASDLDPLAELPLSALVVLNTQVRDLRPLAKVELKYFNCKGSQVTDLSPLNIVNLAVVNCADTTVSDLTPLAKAPLRSINFLNTRVEDFSVLKSISTLQEINDLPAEVFWKSLEKPAPRIEEDIADWNPLFNTSDLIGWEARRSRTIEWKNENGVISGKNRSDRLESGGVLVSEKEFKNFHFRCEVLAGPRSGAAITFRNSDSLVKGERRGYVVFNPAAGSRLEDEGWGIGSLYADDFQVPLEKSRLAQATVKDLGIKPGDWYKLEIIALDEKITIRVNDVTTVEYSTGQRALNRAGHFGLTCQRSGEVSYRNVEVKELKATE